MMKLNLFSLGEANCPLSTSIFLLFGIPPPTTGLTASRSLFWQNKTGGLLSADRKYISEPMPFMNTEKDELL